MKTAHAQTPIAGAHCQPHREECTITAITQRGSHFGRQNCTRTRRRGGGGGGGGCVGIQFVIQAPFFLLFWKTNDASRAQILTWLYQGEKQGGCTFSLNVKVEWGGWWMGGGGGGGGVLNSLHDSKILQLASNTGNFSFHIAPPPHPH